MNPKIAAVLKGARHTVIIEDERVGRIEWVLRPIPAYDLAKNAHMFDRVPKNVDINVDPKTMSADDRKLVEDNIFPIMEVFLPACSVDPPVTIDEHDPRLETQDALHIRDLDMKTMGLLFSKITEISGLSEAADKARKKLQEAGSVKQ